MIKNKGGVIWLLAIVITVAAAIYQRITGPTHPVYHSIIINHRSYKLKLDRTHITTQEALIKLSISDSAVKGVLYFRPFPGNEPISQVDFKHVSNEMIALLPSQPVAGKLQYYIHLQCGNESLFVGRDKPVVTRFRNEVPAWILIPHILFMFFAMLLSSATGLMALFRKESYKKFMTITIVLLFIGGFILGPLVQKFAFGEYWTGFPFGFDLTDNKTLIAFVFWMIAFLVNRRLNERRIWVALASMIMILIFSVPHSMWGSELDHKTGSIMTGRRP